MSQSLLKVHFSDLTGLSTDSLTLSDNSGLPIKREKPVLSFLLDEKMYSTAEVQAAVEGNDYSLQFGNSVRINLNQPGTDSTYWQCDVEFENISADTVTISNVVPFGSDSASVNITGMGPDDLARAWLIRPGYLPVRVILPDNAWELGYTSFDVHNGISVCAVARRMETSGGLKRRYKTVLPPKAKVSYRIYADIFRGEWQNGLKLMFRDRYLYDIRDFDNSLYERADLAWIRESYLIMLQMAWDREFFDRSTGLYTFTDVLRKGMDSFGYIDVYGLWPTWPRLGLDQRNQWDLYRDLPGGLRQLRIFGGLARQNNSRLFIAYNPWDTSTRAENHMKGMAALIAETDADGVVLDTQGSSSRQLQSAADSVRKGVVMYSEGMAVPGDMPGIISGRVHNAIFLSPELNLNKLIKPDFSIFRVCDVGEDVLHREIAISFFNGYGTELNLFRPGGRDENYQKDLEYLARTTFILRQNNDAFLDIDWTPMIGTLADRIYVNRWRAGEKTLFTVLNMRKEGFEGKLFRIDGNLSRHYVSLWNHENIIPVTERGMTWLTAKTEGWPASMSGTRKEGSLDCIAEFPLLLGSKLRGDSLMLRSADDNRVLVWKGNPSNKTAFKEFRLRNDTIVSLKDNFGYYQGKIVVQLLDGKHLLDENIHYLEGGRPWLVSRVEPTVRATGVAPDMILIPGTEFSYEVGTSEDFIPYPEVNGITVSIDSFLIDKYPVTNAQYYEFIQSSGYRPVDTARYLRHWDYGIYLPGQENYPVVYLSLEDMKAYAKWAGKRLPTEAEWQFAAQGTDGRKWPWGNEFHGTLCNNSFGKPTPVDAFTKGMSPWGVIDMVGNVWQMTNDMYFNGSYYMMVIRGGSFYNPESSWWYVKGGPQPLDRTQIMLMVSQGYDRNSTVGFRCVKDIESRYFKGRR
ncbi:MAG: formylglycine-generating enzyme family protein [Bacteroidales bacterium]|nr:formylglycine-generating enzyme family protein [Bacteroidales bacterium]